MPDPADEESIRIYGFDGLTEFFPERVTYLVSDIEPPAVYAEFFYLVTGDTSHVVGSFRIRQIELRHHAYIGKALV